MKTLEEVLRNHIKNLRHKFILSAERDAIILCSHGLGISTNDVLSDKNRLLSESELTTLSKLFRRRASNEPVAKIIERKWFWKSYFYVNNDVLDPRPETELLVETVLARKNFKKNILDLGTGSGCIAISLAQELTDVKIVGCDLSQEALNVAIRNAFEQNVQVVFQKSNWFQTINEKFDIIVCNPPYISTSEFLELPSDVKNYDPEISLLGGADGLDCYRDIAVSIHSYLNEGGLAFFELGFDQTKCVTEILSRHHLSLIEVIRDINNIERVVCVKKDAEPRR